MNWGMFRYGLHVPRESGLVRRFLVSLTYLIETIRTARTGEITGWNALEELHGELKNTGGMTAEVTGLVQTALPPGKTHTPTKLWAGLKTRLNAAGQAAGRPHASIDAPAGLGRLFPGLWAVLLGAISFVYEPWLVSVIWFYALASFCFQLSLVLAVLLLKVVVF